MNHPIESIIGPIDPFMDKIFLNMEKAGIELIEVEAKEIDHIGARTESEEQYEEIKAKLVPVFASLAGEILIRGRKVGTLKLKKPIEYKQWIIPALELLAPAEGDSPYKMGPQHIEIVTEMSLQEIINKYPHVQSKLARPDSHNPEANFKFDDDTGVKFHPISLLDAVKFEQKHGITEM